MARILTGTMLERRMKEHREWQEAETNRLVSEARAEISQELHDRKPQFAAFEDLKKHGN